MDLDQLHNQEALALELSENQLIVPIQDEAGETQLFVIDKQTNAVQNLGSAAKLQSLPQQV